MNTAISRLTTTIDAVNDTVIAGVAGISGASKFAGQLGQYFWLTPDQMAPIVSSELEAFGGRFRYVRRRAADATEIAVGQILFWDTTVILPYPEWWRNYQVTTVENLSSVDNAIFIAGIALGSPTAGNYFFLQDVGQVNVKMRAVLTAAGAVGSRVYAAAAGAGADAGLGDVIDSANPTLFSDVSLMQARYLGNGVTAPVGAATSPVTLGFHNLLG